jgi:hypothetical protein
LALEKLASEPELVSTPALRLLVTTARAEFELAEGRLAPAVALFRSALADCLELDAPLAAAQTRCRLGRVLLEAHEDPLASIDPVRNGMHHGLWACRGRRVPVSMGLMQIKFTILALAACLFASCDKGGKTTESDSPSSKKPQVENRTSAPTNKEKTAQAANDPTSGNPADTAPAAASSAPPTPEQMIARFKSDGIAGVPKDVADTIIEKATRDKTPEEQVRFITEQSAAWQHINRFTESINNIPDHMKRMLLERLSTKHGDSWKDMAIELDEQVAASAKVDELRAKGISGMTPDESQDFIIQALEKHGPDYKTIVSIADQSAGK